MFEQLAFRVAVPMVAVSLLLLGLGSAAAWNAQRQQVTTQNLIVHEMQGLLATRKMGMHAREIVNLLQHYLRTHDQRLLESIISMRAEADASIEEARQFPRSSAERELMAQIEDGYRQFWSELERVRAEPGDTARDAELVHLAEVVLPERVISAAETYMQSSHEVVARANAASRQMTTLTRQGFLLLGLCGCTGGLVAGWGMARAIRHTLVRLEISVRSVASRLDPVAGPVTFRQEGGRHELEAGLSQMEQHICALIERLQQTELQMLKSEHLAAVGQLAAGLAHELRNPLMPIKTLVQTAMERGSERGLSGQSLAVIDREIHRMEGSIQNFLDFARPQLPAKAKLDLIDRITQTLSLAQCRADQQAVRIHCDLPQEPIAIEADSGQLHQVLLNLIFNAIDALPHGGDVYLRARVRRRDGIEQAVIEVTDTGPGMPPDVLPRVFEPFVTTKETGTGLGLSISQKLIQAHGGTITASNRPTGGALFVVTLPARGNIPVD